MLSGISSSAVSDAASGSEREDNRTGSFSDTAEDGFMSCRGDGCRLMLAD